MQRRIVSLVPSLSETIYERGLGAELVGCTQFCVFPPRLHRTAQIVGGTKDFSIEAIDALRPTHIVANQEENPRVPIEELAKRYSVLCTFPRQAEDVPPMLRDLGHFLASSPPFEDLASRIEETLLSFAARASGKSFAYFIWREPYMLVGPDTYISRLLELAGWKNAYQGEERYPALSLEEIHALHPDALLLSSEPYPFRMRDARRLREAWPESPAMYKVDGRLLSWYGSSTLEALRYLGEEPRQLGNLLLE